MRACTTLYITREEADHILTPMGKGGQQGFHKTLRALVDEYATTYTNYPTFHIHLTDAQLGKLIRYMTMNNGRGGFQGRLKKTFGRALIRHLSTIWKLPE